MSELFGAAVHGNKKGSAIAVAPAVALISARQEFFFA
jgi:hypothetical protein